MKTILKSSVFEGNELIETYNKNFREDCFQEEVIEVNNENAQGYFKELKLDGIRVSIRDIKTRYHEISVQHDFPFFKLQFEIIGSSLYTPYNELEKTVYIPGGHYNLFYLPEVNGLLSYNTNYRKTLEIIFTEEYIKKIIGDDFKNDLQNFGEAISTQKPYLMWSESMPITSEILMSLNEIINCEFKGNLKKAYVETKVNELLIVLLAATNKVNQTSSIGLSENDYSKMLLVKEYIFKNLKDSLTIAQLASYAGINTSKLKQDFKTAFSSTIFKYITKLRMEMAKKLLLENNYSISEIADMVGYKHAQHFTVAFKKVYGYLPSKKEYSQL